MHAPPQTDEELSALTSQGDREAFATLYDRYFDSVYDFASRLASNPDAGADIAQTSFTKAYQELGRNRVPKQFKPWLFKITRNAAMDYWRSARRTTPLERDEEDEERPFEQVDETRLSDPQEVIRDQELVGMVWEAASSLSRKEYAVLDFHLRQDMTPEEIATAMGMRRGAVHTMLSRVRDSLEGAVVSLLLLRQGRRDCPELDRLVSPMEQTTGLSSVLRKRIQRHLSDCDVCEGTRQKIAAPSAMFGALAPVAIPIGLKGEILAGLGGPAAATGVAVGADGGGQATVSSTSTGGNCSELMR